MSKKVVKSITAHISPASFSSLLASCDESNCGVPEVAGAIIDNYFENVGEDVVPEDTGITGSDVEIPFEPES